MKRTMEHSRIISFLLTSLLLAVITSSMALQDDLTSKNCTRVNVSDSRSLQKVKEVKRLHYNLFVKPREGFERAVFHLVEDNVWTIPGADLSDEPITFSGNEVEVEVWSEVKIDYIKHEVKGGPDRHGLKVTIGNHSRVLRSHWWRTHTYEGFRISAQGPSTFLFDCAPVEDAATPVAVRHLYTPAMMGSGMAVVLVVAVAAWVCVVRRRCKGGLGGREEDEDDDMPPEVPPLPKSFLLTRNKVSTKPDHIYEEFDEDTLARLRQKFPPTDDNCGGKTSEGLCEGKAEGKTLCGGGKPEVRAVSNVYDELGKPRPVLLMQPPEALPRKENTYENTGITLQEEKEKARAKAGKKVESHYVVMHGIVDPTVAVHKY